MKLAVDRKKISRGKGQNMGDIDCWGFESQPSVLDRKENHNEEMNFLNTFQERVDFFGRKGTFQYCEHPTAGKIKDCVKY
jgi:hypothetical protein